MGRKPLGEKKLSNSEKQKRYRGIQHTEERKEADKLRKQIERKNIYEDEEKHMKYLAKKNIAQ